MLRATSLQNNMIKKRFLVLGAGVVGQVYAAFLGEAGHDVVIYTRSEKLPTLLKEGIVLKYGSKPVQSFHKFRAVDSIENLGKFDYILPCFRADQRAAFEEILTKLSDKSGEIVLCFPMWKHQTLKNSESFKAIHFLMPGIKGLFREDHIFFTHDVTYVSLWSKGTREMTKTFAAILSATGLKTKYFEDFGGKFQNKMCMGIPVLLGVAASGHSVRAFAKNFEARKLTADSMKELLSASAARGVAIPLYGKLILALPKGLIRFALWVVGKTLPGFYREMIEIHFHKVHQQNLMLIYSFIADGKSGKYGFDSTLKLLRLSGGKE